jgi:predicted CxxxxCH...CXXCH cytochrome family protein
MVPLWPALNLRNLAPAIEDEVFVGAERSLAQTLAECDERPHRCDIGPAATAGPVEGVRSDKLWSEDAVGAGLVGRAVFAAMTRRSPTVVAGARRRCSAGRCHGSGLRTDRSATPTRHGTDVLPLDGPTCSIHGKRTHGLAAGTGNEDLPSRASSGMRLKS